MFRVLFQKCLFSNNFIEKMIAMTKTSSTNVSPQSQNSLAEKILQKIGRGTFQAEYEAKLRAKVTLQSRIQQLEKQLRQQIARALRQTQQKLIYKLKLAQKTLQYLNQLKNNRKQWTQQNLQLVNDYHSLIKQCYLARQDLIIHRHAVGFTIKNHQIVYGLYPLPQRFDFNEQLS